MFNPLKKYKQQKEIKQKITQQDRFNSALSNFEVNQLVNGNFEEFVKQFRDHSLIMLIVGRRGAGKTALGMKLVETAAILDKNIFVISDEIYEVLSYDSREHVSFASSPEAAKRTITVNGFSKSYSMTGWRLGYLAGPAEIINQASKI